MNYFNNHNYTSKPSLSQSKSQNVKKRAKPIQLNGYPSGDSQSSSRSNVSNGSHISSSSSSSFSNNNNNNNNNQQSSRPQQQQQYIYKQQHQRANTGNTNMKINMNQMNIPQNNRHSHNNHHNNNNNNNNHKPRSNPNNERKTIYKFKSGEQFISYPYLTPQKIIGEGSYASVCSALDTRTKKKYAIKKNRNAFVNIGDAKRILREIKLMYHFQGHPNLMSVIDVIPPDIGTQQKFNDVYLIMPKMHMTLSKLIMKTSIGKIKIYECDIQTIMYQICRGLEYMHSGGVIHRDLKPENILINCYYHHCDDPNCLIQNKNLWQVRVTDFGLARGINSPQINSSQSQFIINGDNHKNTKKDKNNNNNNNLTEYVVTRYYRAPEVMCCSRLYDTQIDVWSLGCIMGEMYYKKPLFRGNNHLHQLQVIFYYCGTPNNLNWVKMNDAKQWIAQLPKHQKKNFKKEFSFYNYCNSGSIKQQQPENKCNNNNNNNNNLFDGQQQENTWYVENDDKCGTMSDLALDFLDKLLLLNPNQRWNISQALRHPWLQNLYKQTDYHRCPPFDTTFEKEPILRTNFGVRHMMYEELLRIHKNCKNNLLPKQQHIPYHQQ